MREYSIEIINVSIEKKEISPSKMISNSFCTVSKSGKFQAAAAEVKGSKQEWPLVENQNNERFFFVCFISFGIFQLVEPKQQLS